MNELYDSWSKEEKRVLERKRRWKWEEMEDQIVCLCVFDRWKWMREIKFEEVGLENKIKG